MRDAHLPSSVTLEQQLDTQTSTEVTVDPERLSYVTRLLGSQQGLKTALFGAYLFLLEVWRHMDWPSGWLAVLAFGASYWVFFNAFQRWIPRYYRERFGSVQAHEPSARWFGLFLVALIALLFFGQPAAHYLDPRISAFVDRLHLAISDPAHQVNLWPSFVWVALFMSSVRWHMGSVERPRLYLLVGCPIAFAAIAIYGIWHPDARQLGVWRVLNNTGGLGLSLMAMGLCDYIVLIRALPKKVSEGDDE